MPESRLERVLFRKVELWVVLLLLLLIAILTVLFGAAVVNVADGGRTTGFVGDLAYQIATIPRNLKTLLQQKDDWSSPRVALILDSQLYQPLESNSLRPEDRVPIGWASDKAPLQPLAVTFRLNDAGDESLFILDEYRKVVNSFPLNAITLSGKYNALLGASLSLILDDGSLLTFPQGADGLFRKDLCGNVIWSTAGMYHHDYSVVDGKLFILGLPQSGITSRDRKLWNHSDIINVINIETGEIERSVTIDQIARKNAARFDPFLWERWRHKLNHNGVLTEDLVHLNKVEVLSVAMADQYPNFDAGVWMLSSRQLNLIFILDPVTLEILWFSQGHTQVQHDPKFVGDNSIMIFNNRFSGNSDNRQDPANFSSIDLYDFTTAQWREVYHASAIGGFTDHSGGFDISASKDLILSFTLQGRFVEVSSTGELLSEIISIRDDSTAYWSKRAQYLSEKQFQIARNLKCEK